MATTGNEYITGKEYKLEFSTPDKIKTAILNKFLENKLLLTTHAFEYILSHKFDDLKICSIIKYAKSFSMPIVSEEFIISFINGKENKGNEIIVEKDTLKENIIKDSPIEEEINEEIGKIAKKDDEIKNFKISEYNVTTNGTADDFLKYFVDRFENLAKIIKQRVDYRSVDSIGKLKENTETKIIGMIREKRVLKDGRNVLTVEDTSGSIDVYVNNNLQYGDKKAHLELLKILPKLVVDEVIGIKGYVNRSKKIIAEEIVEPDIPTNFKGNRANNDFYIAFLSDLHVGSYLFLEKEFRKFIDWTNLRGERKEIARKLKYILIAGDIVDGIGIYPEQEKELNIPDIYKQYEYVARLLKEIPNDIEIFMIMGNHDATHLAEPQSAVSAKVAPDLYKMKNVHVLSNPSLITIENVKILMYHGASMDNLIRAISGLTYTSPEEAMTEFLRKRHLNIMYKDVFPCEKDYLIINEIPDIIHSGHLHSNGYAIYKGVHLINSGCFQGRTKYMEQLGHIPTPSRVPIMNLRTFDSIELNFSID